MKTVRRLFYRDIVSAVVFVALAFLSLFFFIDFVDELGDVGQRGYTAVYAALYSLLLVPGHIYEVAPIAVLIGTIYTLSRMAQSSEFTILRTGGLGPGRALQLLLTLGVAMGVITYLVGEYVAPLGEQQATSLKARLRGGQALGRTGAWLKERRGEGPDERSLSINVQGTDAKGEMRGIRVFEHDANGVLVRRLQAATARAVRADGQSVWRLQDAVSYTHLTLPTNREV